MLIFLGKAILLYILTIVVIRLMGKATFAQLTAHDLTGVFFVVSLAIGPLMTEKLTYAIVGLATVGILHIVLSKLTLLNGISSLFIGQPTIVIKHGKLIKINLKKSRFTLGELLSNLREKGYPNISNIEYAIIETSGEISVLPNQKASPVTPKLLEIETAYQGLPMAVIIEGKTQHRTLELIDKDEKWLKKELEIAGFQDQHKIFYASVQDNDHKLTIDTGEGDFR